MGKLLTLFSVTSRFRDILRCGGPNKLNNICYFFGAKHEESITRHGHCAGYYMPSCDSHKPEIKWRSRRHFRSVSNNYLHYRSSEFMLSPHQWMPSYCLPLSTEMLYNQSANSTQQGWMLSVCLDHQGLSPTRLRRQSW